MHRYQRLSDCDKHCGKGDFPALADSREYAGFSAAKEIPAASAANRTSSQYDGADFARPFDAPTDIITATTSEIPGYRIERCMGTVIGMGTRSRGFFPTLGAELKTIKGGKIDRYNELVSILVYRQFPTKIPELTTPSLPQAYWTHQDAVARMCMECRRLGANAVVGMRFDAGFIEATMSQVCGYGTAVYVVKTDGDEKYAQSKRWG